MSAAEIYVLYPHGIPGDPGEVEALANGLEFAAMNLEFASSSVRLHGEDATSEWEGSAGDAAREVLGRVAGYVGTYADRTGGSAPALKVYAGALRAAQAKYGEGLAARAAAQAALEAARDEQANLSAEKAVATIDAGDAGWAGLRGRATRPSMRTRCWI
ncbi:MAG: hypothetical protein ACRYF3_01950 [Janthinobacterium lividum]